MKRQQTIIKAFADAFNGLLESFRTQLNFRIHILATALTVLTGLFLQLSAAEWAIVTLTIAMVVVCEQINTAIEYLVDFISPEYHVMAGKIKDLAAGAVLLTSIAAIIVGIIIFLPRILALIQ